MNIGLKSLPNEITIAHYTCLKLDLDTQQLFK